MGASARSSAKVNDYFGLIGFSRRGREAKELFQKRIGNLTNRKVTNAKLKPGYELYMRSSASSSDGKMKCISEGNAKLQLLPLRIHSLMKGLLFPCLPSPLVCDIQVVE